jgi:hypothetical protein
MKAWPFVEGWPTPENQVWPDGEQFAGWLYLVGRNPDEFFRDTSKRYMQNLNHR